MRPELKLSVSTSGSGPDLVLLHGWGFDSRIWKQVSAELASGFQIHLVDMPGYRSNPFGEPYTLGQIAARLAEEMPQSVCVCAWSLGGQIALQWAHDAPKQVERLVLVATTPRFIASADWDYGMEETVFDSFSLALAQDHSNALQRFISLVAQGDTNAKRIVAEIRQQLHARSPELASLQTGLAMLADTDLRETVRAIKQSCLLIHGDCDTITSLGAARWLAASLPNANLHSVAGAGHAPFLSQPASFVKTVSDYLHG